MTNAFSPSSIAAEALGLTPHGVAWIGPEPMLCALERRPLLEGEPCVPFKPGANFMDDAIIARSSIVSGAAALFLAKSVMMKTQRAVFCTQGAFSLATDAARGWFFLSPPEPPYVAVIADSMLQHLVWRAPVNLSRELIQFRHGAKIHSIRRTRLIQFLDALRAHDGPAFVILDREGKHPSHGILRRDCPPDLAQLLSDATPGELIALATLAKKKPVAPERPEPFTL